MGIMHDMQELHYYQGLCEPLDTHSLSDMCGSFFLNVLEKRVARVEGLKLDS